MKINLTYKTLDEFIDIYLGLYEVLSKTRLDTAEKLFIKAATHLLEEDKFKHQMFYGKGKHRLLDILKNVYGSETKILSLNNKIYALLRKKFLIKDSDGIVYLPKHYRHIIEQVKKVNNFQFTIDLTRIKEENEDRPD